MNFTIYSVLPLICGFLLAGFGFFVLLKKTNSELNVTFFLLCTSTALWALGYSFMYASMTIHQAIFWARFGYVGVVFIPISLYHFTITFLSIKKSKILLYSLYVFGFIWVYITRTDLFINSMYVYFWGYYPKGSYLYPVWVLIYGMLFFRSVQLLYRAYVDKSSRYSATQKEQIKYVLLAFLIATFSLVDYLQNFNIGIYPFGYIIAFICIQIIAYAITKLRLLDIEIVIKRSIIYSLLTALITGIFVSLILVGNYLFSGMTGYNSLWGGIIGAFAIALVFQPLRDVIQGVVDRTFFRSRYDYQHILSKYSHALAQPMSDLTRFAKIAPYLLTKAMKLSSASVMVLNREDHTYTIRAGEREAHGLIGQVVPEHSPLIQEILAGKRGFSLDEIMEAEKNALDLEEKKRYQAVADAMKQLKCILVIPSISEGQYFNQATLLATINLGPKMSSESYSHEDIDFLKTLANQAAISIEYAFILEELKKNQARVIRSEKLAAVGTTTAGVAHELKNPLTYINTLAQLLPTKWQDKAFMEEAFKMLPAETQRMSLIVEGLLDYSRSKELMLIPVDVSSVTDKALALLIFEIRKSTIEVNTRYHHKQMASGDPNRLMQVFMNLIANAVQAMGDRGSGGRLTIITKDVGDKVETIIADTGPGMSALQLEKIFDPFYTTKEEGTGLGLPISKKIVEDHHGEIIVESQEGIGTTFTVTLPAVL